MSAHSSSINLLPESEFESSFWGKFLRWAVSSGRYIIIVTELVVILAFMSRFKLDQDLRDLESTIQGQKNILSAQAPIEKEFREKQAKIDQVKQLIQIQMQATDIMDLIAQKIPAEVKVTTLDIGQTSINLSVTTLSEKSLGDMITALSTEKKWKSVEVTSFAANKDMGIKVGLVINM